ncbi:MAG: ubiquinol-cytochrome c reductase iron-sulfur subunit [Alphaproteobacteria bacterium]|nr:ubiquinol-cytochrome c reductase iron-sulfur subunit [Alphaproteobacteria bacterium]
MSESKNNPTDETKRDFVILTSSSIAVVGAACAAWPLIDSLNPSAEVLALSSIEVNLEHVQEGQAITVKWQGKPVFIKHRTQKEIDEARAVNVSTLKDPQSDDERVEQGKEQWLITVGICTHLGCIPINKQGDYDGWFCPCHGSHYDSSGRIRKGPASFNLAVPPYEFLTDTKIKIG